MNTSIRIDLPGIFRPFGADKDGTGVSPQFRMYRCRDGVWLFVCALTPPFFFKLLEAVDLMEIMLIPEVEGEFARFVHARGPGGGERAVRRADGGAGLRPWARVRRDRGALRAGATRAEWAASETVAANDLSCSRCRPAGTVGPGLPRCVAHAGHADAARRPPRRAVADLRT